MPIDVVATDKLQVVETLRQLIAAIESTDAPVYAEIVTIPAMLPVHIPGQFYSGVIDGNCVGAAVVVGIGAFANSRGTESVTGCLKTRIRLSAASGQSGA